MGFSTDAIHAGQIPDPTTGAIMTPVYQTSTYVQDELGKHKGYEYARTHNLTRAALEKNVATLEKGKFGFAFGSGMAATSALAVFFKTGYHVIVSDNVYGGTFRYFDKVVKNWGVKFSWVDTTNPQNVKDAITPETKMIFIETPTNPILNISDIEAIGKIAKNAGAMLVVDNTFMSPYLQSPLTLGADIVLHSATKYLGGHSDVVLGMLLTSSEEIAERLAFMQNSSGMIPGPWDSWLVLRSTKTLALRMRAHCENAQKIAEFLDSHPKVEKVFYPGLESHPQHELAKKQMRGFGGMVTLEMGSVENAKKFLDNVKIFALAESLGGVESLISHPVSMTHASVPKEERLKFGLTDGIVRLSVGVEDLEDLIEDLENALSNV
ncbi:MAG: cystathionine gamma-synthase [Calditrichaeota bacterium]|nr:MAG: cystathionine gamma-synthase [Calditrichota bacterium]